ncbi:EAL domain-containing protein [Geomonas sp. RF6]|uniref:putative bifunctional diguanylate cyclase/phosphodiesterase n=1 Tax=Geomonas sp. RF6 TaxID=2897342 RepID=UPI001E55BF9A|nr:EAL domain-containing protein [Geomonas sp. RF6]UFS71335.1 EAL domain-containing protein [Geomonas sp. RF6]
MIFGKTSPAARCFSRLTPAKITAAYLICSSLWLMLVHTMIRRTLYPRPLWGWVSLLVDALGVLCTAIIVYYLCDRLDARHVATEKRIREQASRDGLTGLYNRQAFDELLLQSVEHARRHQEAVAVLFLDLDRFKSINDTHGHLAGDEVLRETARRLTACCGRVGDDVVARLGGDEFVMILRAPEMPEAPRIVAERVLAAIEHPFHAQGKELNTSASLGISLYPVDSEDATQLVKMADEALYQAKQEGRGRFCFYSGSWQERMHERMRLEHGLRRAIMNDELYLLYQPKLDTSRMNVVGVEALLRWRHPFLGEVSAGSFITLAEQSGLIWQLTQWVLKEACRQAALWFREEGLDLNVAVNVSPILFGHHDLVGMIEKILQDSGLPPDRLTLEITEGTLMHYEEQALAMLDKFGRMGISIHMDDFGTGYSSLASLKNYHFQALKIDRSLVRDVVASSDDAAIATTIMFMAKCLNMEAIAEGVESQAQKDFLDSIDCRHMQGYFFARPLSAEAATAFVRRYNRKDPEGRG